MLSTKNTDFKQLVEIFQNDLKFINGKTNFKIESDICDWFYCSASSKDMLLSFYYSNKPLFKEIYCIVYGGDNWSDYIEWLIPYMKNYRVLETKANNIKNEADEWQKMYEVAENDIKRLNGEKQELEKQLALTKECIRILKSIL